MPETNISPAGLRIIRLLVGNPPLTVAEMAQTVGVTRTAVTEQLEALTEAGFVERETQHAPRRGRPRHLYRTTEAALKLFSLDQQQLVVPAIWRAVSDVCGEETLKKVVKRVSRVLADHYAKRITAKQPRERLRQLIDLLSAEGRLLEVSEDARGGTIIRKRSCPFISMVDPRRSVCQVHRQMLAAIFGRPVRQTGCRHQGDPCCIFEIDEER
jgi:DeoR family suf operon transcriptional repressor